MASSTGTGNLGAVNDDVRIPAPGGQWATAKIQLTGPFVATVTWEYSDDDGTNWKATPWAKRVDAVTANPATAATATVAGIYEVPLAGDATHVRARCSAYTSGAVAVALANRSGGFDGAGVGRPYVPGTPVTFTMFDLISAGGVLNSGNLDMTGWNSWCLYLLGAATGSLQVQNVDEAGAAIANLVNAGVVSVFVESHRGFSASASANVPTNQTNTSVPWVKRALFLANAVAGNRLRLEVSR
jgi:hypothetical protein